MVLFNSCSIFNKGFEETLRNWQEVNLLLSTLTNYEFENAVQQLKPDVALFDLDVGGTSAMDICHWLATHHPDVKRVAYTYVKDRSLLKQMHKAGLNGFFMKDMDTATLISWIKAVAAGHNIYCRQFTDVKDSKVEEIENRLSPFDTNLVKLLCCGYETHDIAGVLHRGTSAVNGYRINIAEKIGTKNPYTTGVMANFLGWVDAMECLDLVMRKK
jgi:DNA-binding NarL/FixJ family response regulator